MNFLEAMKMPIGTEFRTKLTREYYSLVEYTDNTIGLENENGCDITLQYGSGELASIEFIKI